MWKLASIRNRLAIGLTAIVLPTTSRDGTPGEIVDDARLRISRQLTKMHNSDSMPRQNYPSTLRIFWRCTCNYRRFLIHYRDNMKDTTPPEVLNQQSVTIVRLGEDYASVFENMLENLSFIPQLAQSVSPPRLVVDLRHVKYIGSAFLGLMVTVYKTISARESGRFAMCGLNTFCKAAVSVSRLQTRFEVFETVDDAVHAFSADL